MSTSIEEVKGFWNSSPCQSRLSANEDRRKYFKEISERRYEGREWHVPLLARFEDFRDKDVLEIGCGIGTDGFCFGCNGARYVGVDLTPHSVEIARERFELFGVPGEFRVVNAEGGLPFPAESFDHVYSFGVIHHSPKPERIVREIQRVLRPGGTCTVMLYNRSSINYYIEILFLRRIGRWLLLPSFMPRILSRITGFSQQKLEGHRRLLGDRSLTKQEWISRNTDGPNCPLARVYGKAEVAELFQAFPEIRQEVWEFNSDHWPLVRRILPVRLERWIGSKWGWHRMVYATK